ncbi:MAG: PD-(D/E)XK motif protein [Caldilineaceae bacterium]|nr:PD-(D/E)XK motif protein [Caldilineaceae bacterium]
MNLEEVWKSLEEIRITDTPGRVQRRILPAGRRNIFLGLETPSRHRMLILRVGANSVQAMPDIPDSRGLNVRVVSREAGSNEAEVVLTLTESQHQDIFDLLVQDLVGETEHPHDEREGLNRFLTRLSDWQQLLRRLGSKRLSREAQQGLWGELWTLRDVVAPVAGMTGAVDGWRGPMGTDQDFQLGATCVEVKTSTTANLDRLNISGARQLEVPDDVVLILLGLSLDGRAKHGETLAEMIESVRNAAMASGCLHLLDPRLDLSGYERDDERLYSDIGYTVRSLHPFRVEEGFPRIVSSDLRTGISDVRYQVSTASCDNFRMTEQRPERLLEGLI